VCHPEPQDPVLLPARQVHASAGAAATSRRSAAAGKATDFEIRIIQILGEVGVRLSQVSFSRKCWRGNQQLVFTNSCKLPRSAGSFMSEVALRASRQFRALLSFTDARIA
jgi:hypothetical protein